MKNENKALKGMHPLAKACILFAPITPILVYVGSFLPISYNNSREIQETTQQQIDRMNNYTNNLETSLQDTLNAQNNFPTSPTQMIYNFNPFEKD